MDPLQAAAVGLAIADRVAQAIKDNREIPKEELARMIANNLVQIGTISDRIRAEIKAYGG